MCDAGFFSKGHLDDSASVEAIREYFKARNPGYRLGCGTLDGEAEWTGSRVLWLQDGAGEVWLPEGYRTKEGDGERLPVSYVPEPAPPEWIDGLEVARRDARSFSGSLRAALDSLCSRLDGSFYRGDCAYDLWSWLEYGGAAPDRDFAAFLDVFERCYDRVGFSVKRESSWEPLAPGDQLIPGSLPLRVRGRFRYWFIDTPLPITHSSAARRLRYLKDTAGGCNFQFDAFRRMTLTCYPKRGVTPDNPDGINQVNSHFVNVAAETSRAHYHPREAVGGGRPQGELYFVLDPATRGLSTHGRQASVVLWPDPNAFDDRFHVPLRPGSVVYIPPGIGHRGVDVFANVVVLPAYKLRNLVFLPPQCNW